MNYLTPSKVIAYLVLIFVAGGVAGAALALKHAPTPVAPAASMEKVCSRFQERLTTKLALNPDQVHRLKPVFDQTAAELHLVHTRALHDTDAVIRRAYEEIDKELTPEQHARLQQCNRERNEILSRRLKDPDPRLSEPAVAE
jgi:Spy/CpxP family protein refolding chaperone